MKLNNGTSLNKIHLLLKAIDLEKGNSSSSKCLFLLTLSKCLSIDKNDKIELLNGKRYNKQQLLIDTYEDYNGSEYAKYCIPILQELSKKFEDDDEIITLKCFQFSKKDLFSIIDYIYKGALEYQERVSNSSTSPSNSFF